MPLHIKWYRFVRNDDVRRITKQPKLCNNPVAPTYPVWAYYGNGRQRGCQENPVSLPSGGMEKTPRLSPHHVAQHRPTGSETTTPYAPRSSRFGLESPSVEDDVDVWRYVACQKRRRRPQKGTSLRGNACFGVFCVKIRPGALAVASCKKRKVAYARNRNP